MIARISTLPRGAVIALSAVVTLVLAWRVLVVGMDALQQRADATDQHAAGTTPGKAADAPWRERLARNPADATALLKLAIDLEAQGKKVEAGAAMQQALRLAPGDLPTLMQTAAYFLRAGDEAQGLVTLRRAIDASRGDVNSSVWEVFLAALDADRHRAFFDGIARDNPAWWPGFFRLACERAANVGAVQAVYAMRVQAAVATVDEQRCIIGRLQRDGQWATAYQLWLNGLPVDQRQRVGAVFNGDFELPLSNVGFDWLVPTQDGIEVTRQPIDGATGQRALNVTFVNKRYSEPPVYQYLMLNPGTYRFEGRGRTDLESWLGLQWGVYCNDAPGREPRQLAHSDRFVGSVDWRDFRQDFAVPKDCPVQLLRLELANPKRDANTAGAVVVRLKGRVWFDALRVASP